MFATQKEAEEYTSDLFARWTSTDDHRAVEAPDAKVNAKWENGKLIITEE